MSSRYHGWQVNHSSYPCFFLQELSPVFGTQNNFLILTINDLRNQRLQPDAQCLPVETDFDGKCLTFCSQYLTVTKHFFILHTITTIKRIMMQWIFTQVFSFFSFFSKFFLFFFSEKGEVGKNDHFLVHYSFFHYILQTA